MNGYSPPTSRQWARRFVCVVTQHQTGVLTRPMFRLELGKLEDLAARAEISGWAVPRVPQHAKRTTA